ncbi:uncharacterized protein kif16bb [Sardina pilchardus]|uniref:uncharacterized protein kif16bb n=1 Tax=Sardina pilchardus TaxID=27697 RepID=UPI002E149EE5
MVCVRVAVRVRPLNKREKDLSSKVIIRMEENKTSILNVKDILMNISEEKTKSFIYDFSYDSSNAKSSNFATQDKVFTDLGRDVLEAAFEGYNACIFAYGQTGSGKSYTMMGTADDVGLTPRICEGLFSQITGLSQTDHTSFHTSVSYLEIYNERVRDLLGRKLTEGSCLRVREHPRDGPYVEGLSKQQVHSYSDVERLMEKGNASRATASTAMNQTSSRSHAIFTINFRQARFDAELPSETTSKIHLVDLAGSERAASTGASGTRLKEGANINKSLVALGNVISALADVCVAGGVKTKRKGAFVPYRDSVLTWLLKDSLGGNSKTIMIATISPAHLNYGETLNTLRYANRVKNIMNQPTVNEDGNVKIIRELRDEIAHLKALLAQGAHVSPVGPRLGASVEEKLHRNEARVLQLTQEWTNKWKETQSILREETVALRKEGSGVVLDSGLPHLIGIDDDLLSTGVILYRLQEGRTSVGRADAATKQDIVLDSAGIMTEHCVFENRDGAVILTPLPGASCSVSGAEVTRPCPLTQGAVVLLGTGTTFRFNHPKEAAALRLKRQSGLLSVKDFSGLSEMLSKAALHISGGDLTALRSGQNVESKRNHDDLTARTSEWTSEVVEGQRRKEEEDEEEDHGLPIMPQEEECPPEQQQDEWTAGQLRSGHHTEQPCLSPASASAAGLNGDAVEDISGQLREDQRVPSSGENVESEQSHEDPPTQRWTEEAEGQGMEEKVEREEDHHLPIMPQEEECPPEQRQDERTTEQLRRGHHTGQPGLSPASASAAGLNGDAVEDISGQLRGDLRRLRSGESAESNRSHEDLSAPTSEEVEDQVAEEQRRKKKEEEEEDHGLPIMPQEERLSEQQQDETRASGAGLNGDSAEDINAELRGDVSRGESGESGQSLEGLTMQRWTSEEQREKNKEGEDHHLPIMPQEEECPPEQQQDEWTAGQLRSGHHTGQPGLSPASASAAGLNGDAVEDISGQLSCVTNGLTEEEEVVAARSSSSSSSSSSPGSSVAAHKPVPSHASDGLSSFPPPQDAEDELERKQQESAPHPSAARAWEAWEASQAWVPWGEWRRRQREQDGQEPSALRPADGSGSAAVGPGGASNERPGPPPDVRRAPLSPAAGSGGTSLVGAPLGRPSEDGETGGRGAALANALPPLPPLPPLPLFGEPLAVHRQAPADKLAVEVQFSRGTVSAMSVESSQAQVDQKRALPHADGSSASDPHPHPPDLSSGSDAAPPEGGVVNWVSFMLKDAGRHLRSPPTQLLQQAPALGRLYTQVCSLVKDVPFLQNLKLELTMSPGAAEARDLGQLRTPARIKELLTTQKMAANDLEVGLPRELGAFRERLPTRPEQRLCEVQDAPGEMGSLQRDRASRENGLAWHGSAVSSLKPPRPSGLAETDCAAQQDSWSEISEDADAAQMAASVQVWTQRLVDFPAHLRQLQSLPVSSLLPCLLSVLPDGALASQRPLAVWWLSAATCVRPEPRPALALLLESALYTLAAGGGPGVSLVSSSTQQPHRLAVLHHLPLLQVTEIHVGFAGQSVRLTGSTAAGSVVTLYTHSAPLTQDLCRGLLTALGARGKPAAADDDDHPLLTGDLRGRALDWTARPLPDLLLAGGLRVSSRFQKSLAQLVCLLHGNMDARRRPALAQVRVLTYAGVRLSRETDRVDIDVLGGRRDDSAEEERGGGGGGGGAPVVLQFFLTDTHLGLLQEDALFYPPPRSLTLVPSCPQFRLLQLRPRDHVRCLLIKDSTRLEVCLSFTISISERFRSAQRTPPPQRILIALLLRSALPLRYRLHDIPLFAHNPPSEFHLRLHTSAPLPAPRRGPSSLLAAPLLGRVSHVVLCVLCATP